MVSRTHPVVVFTADAEEALDLFSKDKDSRALLSVRGTLLFHRLIAEHGAGVFKTLYCPLALRDQWKTPAGAEIRYSESVQP